VLKTFRNVRPAVQQLLERLPDLRANVRRLDNRAVFEVPEILTDILHRAAGERCVVAAPVRASP